MLFGSGLFLNTQVMENGFQVTRTMNKIQYKNPFRGISVNNEVSAFSIVLKINGIALA